MKYGSYENKIKKIGSKTNDVIEAKEEYFFKNAINNQVIINTIPKMKFIANKNPI